MKSSFIVFSLYFILCVNARFVPMRGVDAQHSNVVRDVGSMPMTTSGKSRTLVTFTRTDQCNLNTLWAGDNGQTTYFHVQNNTQQIAIVRATPQAVAVEHLIEQVKVISVSSGRFIAGAGVNGSWVIDTVYGTVNATHAEGFQCRHDIIFSQDGQRLYCFVGEVYRLGKYLGMHAYDLKGLTSKSTPVWTADLYPQNDGISSMTLVEEYDAILYSAWGSLAKHLRGVRLNGEIMPGALQNHKRELAQVRVMPRNSTAFVSYMWDPTWELFGYNQNYKLEWWHNMGGLPEYETRRYSRFLGASRQSGCLFLVIQYLHWRIENDPLRSLLFCIDAFDGEFRYNITLPIVNKLITSLAVDVGRNKDHALIITEKGDAIAVDQTSGTIVPLRQNFFGGRGVNCALLDGAGNVFAHTRTLDSEEDDHITVSFLDELY